MLIDLEDAHAFHVSTFGGLSPFGIHEGVALRLSASTLDFCLRMMILPGRRLTASAKAARATA
jgi:hypothetical protein